MITDTQYQVLATNPSAGKKTLYYYILWEFDLSSNSSDWAQLYTLLKRLSTEEVYLDACASCDCAQIFFEEIIIALGEGGYDTFRQIFTKCYHDRATRADFGFTDLCHWNYDEEECEDFLFLDQETFISRMAENPIRASALFAMLAGTIKSVKHDAITGLS